MSTTSFRRSAVSVGGQIGVVWQSLGGASGPLGNPTGNEFQASPSFMGTRGNFRNFAGAKAYYYNTR